jgi:hypothetical protein
LRSLAYADASSMLRFIIPTAPPPRPVRPLLRIVIAVLKPPLGGPRRLLSGTRTLSRNTDVVELARMPILSSCGPMLTPSMSRVTMNAPRFARSSATPVFANTVKKSAMPPLVIHSLLPLMIQSSPSRVAVVLIDAASEPAPGSVRQNAAIISPLASLGRKRSFCSSSPNKSNPFMPIELCAPTVIATEASCFASCCSERE